MAQYLRFKFSHFSTWQLKTKLLLTINYIVTYRKASAEVFTLVQSSEII